MSKRVPYVSEEAIERDAEALLAEYEHARNVTIAPPVPIDDTLSFGSSSATLTRRSGCLAHLGRMQIFSEQYSLIRPGSS